MNLFSFEISDEPFWRYKFMRLWFVFKDIIILPLLQEREPDMEEDWSDQEFYSTPLTLEALEKATGNFLCVNLRVHMLLQAV